MLVTSVHVVSAVVVSAIDHALAGNDQQCLGRASVQLTPALLDLDRMLKP